MLEVGFEGCLGARWAGHACSSALSPWAEGLPEWADPLCHGLCSPAFHYECNNEADKQEFEKALETIAVSFSST